MSSSSMDTPDTCITTPSESVEDSNTPIIPPEDNIDDNTDQGLLKIHASNLLFDNFWLLFFRFKKKH